MTATTYSSTPTAALLAGRILRVPFHIMRSRLFAAGLSAAFLALSPTIAGLGSGSAVAEEPAVLTLKVSKIEKLQGSIMAGMYQGAEGWSSGKAVTGASAAVDGETVTLTFEGVPAGEYGIKLYQDVNGNGKLDTNFMGIPTEPFAFSNNARGSMGPPSYDKARFEMTPGANTHAVALN